MRHHVSLGEVVVACRRNARVRFRIHFVPIDTGTWKTYVSQGLLGRILHQLTDFATSLNAFVRGLSQDDPLDTYDPQSLEHNSQLHLNVERIRVPEVIWQPHMAGLDQAGLGEVVEHVLKQFTDVERRRLTSVSPLVPRALQEIKC